MKVTTVGKKRDNVLKRLHKVLYFDNQHPCPVRWCNNEGHNERAIKEQDGGGAGKSGRDINCTTTPSHRRITMVVPSLAMSATIAT